jgi:hypothetical protein
VGEEGSVDKKQSIESLKKEEEDLQPLFKRVTFLKAPINMQLELVRILPPGQMPKSSYFVLSASDGDVSC